MSLLLTTLILFDINLSDSHNLHSDEKGVIFMSKAKKTVFDFEKSMIELEKIVEQMEQGNATLEVSLEQFGKAINLIKNCQLTLKNAQQRVQILLNKDDKDILVPFEVKEELA